MQIVKNDLFVHSGLPINQLKDQVKSAVSLNDILNEVCVLYYGIHISQISDVVIKKAITEILKRFNSLSLEEIRYSFERLKLERSVTIVLDDLIKPIQRYVNAKEEINKQHSKIQKELDEQKEAEQKAIDFEKECKDIYNSSLKANEWSGTIYHASIIAKKFLAHQIEQSTKDELFKQAKEVMYKIRQEMEQDEKNIYQHIGKNEIRIYSELIVKEAISRKLELINNELINGL
jgi:hypothetical protein